MFLRTIKVAALGTATLVAIAVPALVLGAEFRVGEQPSVLPNEVLAEDVYLAGGSISSAGHVAGDLLVGGGSILVSGGVGGDANLGGGTITVVGEIGDDLRVVGGTIVVNSHVGGDVVSAGGQVHVSGPGVLGDVVAVGGILRLDAPVSGDIEFRGGEVYLNGTIGGSVDVVADKILIGPSVTIGGDLTYSAPSELTGFDASRVTGAIHYTPREAAARGVAGGFFAFLSIVFLAKFLMLLMGALAIVLLFRRYATTVANDALSRSFASLGRGFVTAIVWPVASILLLVTVIGIPLGVAGLLGFIVAAIFASFIAAILLGSLLHRWIGKQEGYVVTWKTTLAGAIVYSVLSLVPLIGWLIQAILFFMALGAIIKMKWDIAREWR